MENRDAKMIISKSGGTAGKNGMTYRLTIPTTWAKAIGITPEDRKVKIYFDGEKIVVEKEKK